MYRTLTCLISGRAMHGACGQWIDIKMAVWQSDGTVNAPRLALRSGA